MIGRMHYRMRQLDVHAPVRRIVHRALHREQVHAIGSDHDVIDLMQPTTVRGDGQRDGSVLQLTPHRLLVARQGADAMQYLLVHPMMWIGRFRQQRISLGLFERCQRARTRDAIDVQVVGVLEGFDGVEGVGTRNAIR